MQGRGDSRLRARPRLATLGDAPVVVSAEDLSACCAGRSLWGGLDRADFRELQRELLGELAEMLGGLGFEASAAMVLRRPDEFIQSLYQTVIKGGHYRGSFEEFRHYAAPLLDYGGQVAAFRAALGELRVLSCHGLGPELVPGLLGEFGLGTPLREIAPHNPSVDARLSYWMGRPTWQGSAAEEELLARRRFCSSRRARRLFEDYGAASFWPGAAAREEFSERVLGVFCEVAFPPVCVAGGVGARIGEGELARITAAFERWRAARRRKLEKR
jgi:hypothetical protein